MNIHIKNRGMMDELFKNKYIPFYTPLFMTLYVALTFLWTCISYYTDVKTDRTQGKTQKYKTSAVII